jgi:hypothetical protein
VLESFQADSVQPRAVLASLVRTVPPTAVTYCELAGYREPSSYPPSPDPTVNTVPGWSTALSSAVSSLHSEAAALRLTILALLAATLIAAVRSLESLLTASTSTMWHSGQAADTMSRSAAVSRLQLSSCGIGPGWGLISLSSRWRWCRRAARTATGRRRGPIPPPGR